MFRKLKLWSHRLLDRDPGENDELSKELECRHRRCSFQNPEIARSTPRVGGSDPRELPRPPKRGLIRSSSQIVRRNLLHYCYKSSPRKDNVAGHVAKGATECSCANCRSLPQLTECGVCLEPLQGREVHSCTICANLTCKFCASQLRNCPFCRSADPLRPNIAMERLLDRLSLSCKNSRWGCSKLVNGDDRAQHEATCVHGTFNCPVGPHVCGWHGGLTCIESHLRTVHDLQPLTDNTIAIEITGFRGKAHAPDGRQYTVCLSCHYHLYVVKIILFQGKLRLSFTKIGSKLFKNKRKTSRGLTTRYGVWVDISCTLKERRPLKGVLPFGETICDTQEIAVVCDDVVPRDEDDTDRAVKISITIKSLNVL